MLKENIFAFSKCTNFRLSQNSLELDTIALELQVKLNSFGHSKYLLIIRGQKFNKWVLKFHVYQYWKYYLSKGCGFDPWVRKIPRKRKVHSSSLVWRIPWTEEPGGLQLVHGVTKSWTQLNSRVEVTQQHQKVIHQVSFSFYVLLISYESFSKWQIAKEKAMNTYGGNISLFECKCETFNLEIIIAIRHQSIIKLRITRQGRQSSIKLKNQ